MSDQYKHKYLKYKQKYLTLTQQIGGGTLKIIKLDGSEISGYVDDSVIGKIHKLAKDDYIDPPVNLQGNRYAISLKPNNFYSIETNTDPSFTEDINYIFDSNIQDVPKIRDRPVVDFSNYNIRIQIFLGKYDHQIIYITKELLENLKTLRQDLILSGTYKIGDKIYDCSISRIYEQTFKITDYNNFDASLFYNFKLSEDVDILGASKSTSETSLSLSASFSSDWKLYPEYNFSMINGTFSQYNMKELLDLGNDAFFGSCTMNALYSIDIIINKLKENSLLNITRDEIDSITRNGINEYYLPWMRKQQFEKTRNPAYDINTNATFNEGFNELKYDLKYDYKSFENFAPPHYLNNLINNNRELKSLILKFLDSSNIKSSSETYIPVLLIKGTISIALFIPKQSNLPYYIFNSHSQTLTVNREILNIKTSQIYKCTDLDIFVNTILIIAPLVNIPTTDTDEEKIQFLAFNQFEINYLLPKSRK